MPADGERRRAATRGRGSPGSVRQRIHPAAPVASALSAASSGPRTRPGEAAVLDLGARGEPATRESYALHARAAARAFCQRVRWREIHTGSRPHEVLAPRGWDRPTLARPGSWRLERLQPCDGLRHPNHPAARWRSCPPLASSSRMATSSAPPARGPAHVGCAHSKRHHPHIGNGDRTAFRTERRDLSSRRPETGTAIPDALVSHVAPLRRAVSLQRLNCAVPIRRRTRAALAAPTGCAGDAFHCRRGALRAAEIVAPPSHQNQRRPTHPRRSHPRRCHPRRRHRRPAMHEERLPRSSQRKPATRVRPAGSPGRPNPSDTARDNSGE